MKLILLPVLMFGLLFGCSKKKKMEETPIQAEAVVPEQAPEAVPAEPVVQEEVLPEPPPAPAPETQSSGGVTFPAITGSERTSATCSNNGDQREITVLDITGNNGCGVVYTKGGVKNTIAIARNDMGYCDRVLAKVQGNLEANGFDCGGGASSSAVQPVNSEPQDSASSLSSTVSEKAAQAMDTAKEAVAGSGDNDVVDVKEAAASAADEGGNALKDAAAKLKSSAQDALDKNTKNVEDAKLKKMGQ